MNKPMKQQMNGLQNDELMNGQTDERMDGCMHADIHTEGRMDA